VVAVVSNDVVAWEDESVLAHQAYYYRVRTLHAEEQSVVSNYTSATPGIVPAPPSHLDGLAAPVAILLTWVDNSSNELGFQLQRKDGEFLPYKDVTSHPPAGFQIHFDQGLISDHEYEYRIRSYNQYGKSAWITSGVISTPADPGSFSAIITAKFGSQPVEGAAVEIDSGSGFTTVGWTDSFGVYPATGLQVGDLVRVSWKAKSWVSCRNYNDSVYSDLGRHLYFDSDVMNAQGEYSSRVLTNTLSSIDLQLDHTLFRYDLGISTEFDIPGSDSYWTDLASNCQKASDYLWNASDGQIALGRVMIYDNHQKWDDVDVHILHSVHPHADTGQYLDCDDWSANEHFYIGKTLGSDWPATFIHEMGHYGLNLKDEYETVWGGQGRMEQLKAQFPNRYPLNYGTMDDQRSTTEMSSRNDYLTNYDYGCSGLYDCLTVQSEQLTVRGKSCWDYLEAALEGFNWRVDIRKPAPGWFVSGASTSADRTGPTSSIGLFSVGLANGGTRLPPPIEVATIDSGPGTTFGTDIVVRDPAGPVADARVYRSFGDRLMLLGSTDLRGRIDAIGLNDGDELRAYAIRSGGVHRASLPIVRSRVAGGPMTVRLDPIAGGAGRVRGEDTTPPAASIDLRPTGSADDPGMEISIWPDEPLSVDPVVVCYCGSSAEVLPITFVPEDSRYVASHAFDLADSLFDGTGIVEFTLRDVFDNETMFTSTFLVDEAIEGEYYEAHMGSVEINVLGEEVQWSQLSMVCATHTVPYGTAGLYPVSDLHAFHLVDDDEFATAAGMNIAYDDSLLAGLDETTLGAYRWDPVSFTWNLLPDNIVSTRSNVVSAPVSEGGIFGIFATAISDDVTPPGRIEDFGAVGVNGPGRAEVLWTATGDDDMVGVPEQVIIAFSDSTLTDETWELAAKIEIAEFPGTPGTNETATIRLPREGHLYYLAIRAKDEASNLSPLSNVTYVVSGLADANYAPAPVTNMRAVDAPGDDGGVANLTWDLSYDDGGGKASVEGYTIYRNEPPATLPIPLGTVPAGVGEFVDESALVGETYVYWVAAADSAQETLGIENRAFSAQNNGVPIGDFTSDSIVGIDDFSRLVTTFAVDSTDLEFDPIFDLSSSGDIHTDDFEVFRSHYREGGVPTSDPVGENGAMEVLYEIVQGAGSLWHYNVSARGASNLAGYGLRIDYPSPDLTLISATPDSAGTIENLLNRDAGDTPLFLIGESEGTLLIANTISRPSSATSPEGDGFLAHLTFEGPSLSGVQVFDIVLMDHEEGLNYLPGAVPLAVDPMATPVRPFLAPNLPNPFTNVTRFRFGTVERGRVTLRVFDVQGRLVGDLIDDELPSGAHAITWDSRTTSGAAAASGIYFYRLTSPGFSKARKLVLVR
jgi:hypothetical protein